MKKQNWLFIFHSALWASSLQITQLSYKLPLESKNWLPHLLHITLSSGAPHGCVLSPVLCSLSEMVDRKWNLSLTVHFLYQAHGFRHSPLPFRRLEIVFSPFIQIMISTFAPSSPRYILDPFFTRYIFSNTGIFSDNKSRKINFVWHLSLSQQHSLTRFGNRCLPCFTTDIN